MTAAMVAIIVVAALSPHLVRPTRCPPCVVYTISVSPTDVPLLVENGQWDESINVIGFCNICSSLEVDAEASVPKHLAAVQGINRRAGPLGIPSESQPGQQVSLSPLGPTPLGVGAGNSSCSSADNQRAAKKSPLSLGTVVLSLQGLF